MELVRQRFAADAQFRADLRKAYFAYHAGHPLVDVGAHFFASQFRSERCMRCGRSREQVRWDDLPAECSNPMPVPDISGILCGEERKYARLRELAPARIADAMRRYDREAAKRFVWETHGIDEDLFEEFA